MPSPPLTKTLTIELPEPHVNQERVLTDAGRFNVLACGRRWGKTVVGIDRAIRGRKGLLAGFPVGWFAPDYKLLKQAWRDIRGILRDVAVSASDQDKRIEIVNGAVLECWAFDRNPDAGRSRRYGTVIVDEAAHCANLEESWGKAIRPTLTDFKGDAWFISSPNGPSYFSKLYQRGIDGRVGWRSWTQTSYDNPHIAPSEIDAARDDIGDWAFEQEYLAVFHSESFDGLLKTYWVDRLRSVSDECERLRTAYRLPNPKFMGVDLGEGTGRDRTVAVIVDRFGVIHLSQSNQVGIPEAADWIAKLSREWGVREEHVTYDAGGRGKDLPRYLEHYGITQAVPYHGSGKGGLRAKNKRSACAWRLRQRLDPERPERKRTIEYPPGYTPSPFDPPLEQPGRELQPPFGLPATGDCSWWPSMAEELKALRYDMDGVKVRLENKDEMAKRLGRSPDLVDSLLMVMSLMLE